MDKLYGHCEDQPIVPFRVDGLIMGAIETLGEQPPYRFA